MNQQTIGFIGGGNMAYALIGGLISNGWAAERIWASDLDSAKLAELAEQFGVQTTQDNAVVASHSDIVLLAVKPQVLAGVARDLAPSVAQRQPLVISIAAGVGVTDLQRWLGADTALVRCMPNTPAQVRSAATALFATPQVSAEQRDAAESVLRAVGLTVWVDDEALIDAVTAVSGSGPAYFFLFMEAMEDAAQALGLDADTARLLVQQTALGAAKIAIESSIAPAELRRRVTSPGGTTEQAILSFENAGLRQCVSDAMAAAQRRSVEMSQQFGAL